MIATEDNICDFSDLAVSAYPDEAVACITNDGRLVALNNVATHPESEFLVDQSEWEKVKGSCGALVHSHPDGPLYPSCADMHTQISMNIPFGIIMSTTHDTGGYFEWGGSTPHLMDRPFRHGVTDCWGLIRDYYQTNLNITLPDFPRAWDWWNKGGNLYSECHEAAGFRQINKEELREHDMLMFTLRGSNPCHAAIYLGDGKILHHLGGRSGYDPTRKPSIDSIDRWSNHIDSVCRHEELS